MFDNVSEAVKFDIQYRTAREARCHSHPTFDVRKHANIGRVLRALASWKNRCRPRDRPGINRGRNPLSPCPAGRLDRTNARARAKCSAEDRNSVVALPSVVQALRAGRAFAPGLRSAIRVVEASR